MPRFSYEFCDYYKLAKNLSRFFLDKGTLSLSHTHTIKIAEHIIGCSNNKQPNGETSKKIKEINNKKNKM